MKNKGYDHVKKTKAFSKAQIVSELTLTLIRRVLIKSKNKLVFRHCLKMITTRVVRIFYPRDMEHIGYNTDGQVTRTSHSDSHSLLWITVGRLVSEKSNKMTWRFE